MLPRITWLSALPSFYIQYGHIPLLCHYAPQKPASPGQRKLDVGLGVVLAHSPPPAAIFLFILILPLHNCHELNQW
ncbi:hypothetical protein CYLTODRAFT_436354, partial [Cylindrobasidium torrendii FP15055 ss-10]